MTLTKTKSRVVHLLLSFLAFMLVSCGGGGGGSPIAPAPSPPTPSNTAPTNVILMGASSQEVGGLSVSWLPATDDSTPAANIKYQLHASTDAGFTPGPNTLVFEGVGVYSTVLTHLTAGATYSLRLVAVDQQGASTTSNPLTSTINSVVAVAQPGVVTTQLQTTAVAQVNANSVVLNPGVTPPTVGQYIAGSDGGGYLRKVTAVNGTTLQTLPAALNEVASSYQFSTTFTMPDVNQATATAGLQSGLMVVTPAKNNEPTTYTWPQTGMRYSVITQPAVMQAGVVPRRATSIPFTGEAGFTITNNIVASVEPHVTASASLTMFPPDERAKILVSASPTISQELAIHANGQASIDKTVEKVLPERVVWFTFLVAGFPVTISAKSWMDMNINGTVSGALDATEQLTIGFSDISYGVEYANGKFTPLQSVQPAYSFKVGGNGKAEANLKISLIPRLEITTESVLTGAAALEPYASAAAGVEGFVQLDSVVDPNGLVWQFDADYRLTKGSLSGGVDAYLYADFHVLGMKVSYPSNANVLDYKSFQPFVLFPETPFLGLPALSATVDYTAVHPSNKNAIRIARQAINVPNPLKALFGNLPDVFVKWQSWSTTRVIPPIGIGADSYQVLSSPTGNDGEIWVAFNTPGNYTVRVGGYSTWGTWARQYTDVSVAARVGGVCGSSNGLAVSIAPTTNLCAIGPASSVTGSGPWSWSCSGSGGGTNASCSAPQKASSANGLCGSSNGMVLSSAPTTNLCEVGAPSTVTGSGPWNWTCKGTYDGLTTSCSATKQATATPALSITTSSLPATTVGTAYTQSVAASGGQPPYAWSVFSGLPDGLSINATTGSISGTPSVSAIFNFTVTVVDSSSPQKTARQVLTVTVSPAATPALSITTSSLPAATVGTAYAQGVVVSGGQTPYGWSVSSGLPSGLSINATTGAIYGTPSVSGTFGFTVTAADSSSPQKTTAKTLSLTVGNPTCTLSFNTSGSSIDASGAQRQVILTTSDPSCSWSATSNQSWVHNITPSSGTSGATLTYTVDANASAQLRSATITAGQATLTVSQVGTPVACTFSLGYTTRSITAGGGTLAVGLTASNGTCPRTAQSNSAFITDVNPASGNGTANINFTVAANTSTSSRSGTLTIAGQTLTVSQDGLVLAIPTTPVSLSPGSTSSPGPMLGSSTVTVSWNGSSGVTYMGGITDIATGSDVVTINSSGTSTTATLSPSKQYRWYVYACNSSGCSSSSALYYFQTPALTPTCTISFNTSGSSIDASGAQRQVILTTSDPSCSWSATSNQSWVHNITPSSGTSGATLTYTVDLNTSTQSRSATITAGQATLTVSQLGAAASCTFSLGYTTQSVPASGGTFSEGLTASNESCARTAQSNAAFITNVSPASGNGTANISYTVAPNTSATPRSGTLTIAGQTLTVSQDGLVLTIPSTPTIMTPGSTSSPGPTVGSGAVTVSWAAINGATFYGGITDVATGIDVVTINTGGTATTASLSPGKQYRWYVYACNSSGCSSSSALYYFQTPAAAPVLPTGYVSQGGLTWMPVTFYRNWADASAYCAGTIDGQTGWRIPAQPELSALYASGAMNGHGWTLLITWSSTPNGSGYHYNVGLDAGNVVSYDNNNNSYVSCVR